jgi:hypothetical protein
MLQLINTDSDHPYNGSAVLSTYPLLNGTGASLQKLRPAVAGYVQKTGPAEFLHWSQKPHYAIAREAIFLDWRQKELTNPAPQLYAGQQLTCAAARHPPVPFHHCHVFVNHDYKVAYIRSPKSASTSIMNWLGQCRFNKTRNWNSTTCMNYSWSVCWAGLDFPAAQHSMLTAAQQSITSAAAQCAAQNSTLFNGIAFALTIKVLCHCLPAAL